MAIVPRNMEQARQLQAEGYTYVGGAGFTNAPVFDQPQPIPADTVPSVTGAPPEALAATLYDKEIPLVLCGLAAIGGRIIEGPVYGTADGERTASWISGYALNANYAAGNLVVRELRFRGKRAWTLGSSPLMSGLTVSGPTVGTNQTVRFNTGTLTQAPDAWSASRFGSKANAYRPMITATFQNIRVAQFNNLLPHTTVVVADDTFGEPEDGVPWADALPVLAAFAGFEADEFEAVDLTGSVPAMFFAKKQTFIEWLNEHRKIKPYWSIRPKDRLYVVEKAATDIDLTIDRSMVLKSGSDPIVFTTAPSLAQARKLNLTYVDVDRDYDLNTVSAQLEVAPIPATSGYEEESIEIADVMTADVATAAVNLALYSEDLARDKTEFTGKCSVYGLEAGDQVTIETDFRTCHHRVEEVVRNVGCSIEIKVEGMITCGIVSDNPCAAVESFEIGTTAHMGVAVDDTYAYFLPVQNGARVTRVHQSSGSVSSINLLDVNADFRGSEGYAIKDGFLYWCPQRTSGTAFAAQFAKINLSTFDVDDVEFLAFTANLLSDTTWIASGAFVDADGDWLYVCSSSAPGANAPPVLRVSLSGAFSSATIQQLDTTAVHADLRRFRGAVADGTYGYFGAAIFNHVCRLDLSDFSVTGVDAYDIASDANVAYAWAFTATLAPRPWIDGSFLYFLAAGNADEARVGRMNLSSMTAGSSFALSGISTALAEFMYSGATDGSHHYIITYGQGQTSMTVCRIEQNFSSGVAFNYGACDADFTIHVDIAVTGGDIWLSPWSHGLAVKFPTAVFD